MISGTEIHVLDINAEFYGVPPINLMERAGTGVSDFIINTINSKDKKKILLFAGLGNNGGDGFVAARKLSEKNDVTVFLTGEKKDIKTIISKKNFQKLENKETKIFDIKKIGIINSLIQENEIIIDSMLGIGLTGDLREPYKKIVEKINKSKKTIISVDIPTGLGTKTAVIPNHTITFHDAKKGMNKKNCGSIKIVDIGIPKKAIEYVGPGELKTYYPIPRKESHKGKNGRLLVVGGGPFYGAPALSSFAAQRTGIDLIFVATPKKVARAITSYSPLLIKPVRLTKNIAKLSPTLIVKELKNNDILIPEDIDLIKILSKKVDALLIGPGLGLDEKTKESVLKIVKLFNTQKKPIVIDADAIKIVGKHHDILNNSKIILTPHIKEFKELTGEKLTTSLDNKKEKVLKWSKKLGVIIVLKGPTDIISDGSELKLNDVHNVAMTVGGTGDVLAGIIGGLVSKNIDIFNAARMGVFINGYAGNIAYDKRSYGLVATDIIDEIPSVLKKFLR